MDERAVTIRTVLLGVRPYILIEVLNDPEENVRMSCDGTDGKTYLQMLRGATREMKRAARRKRKEVRRGR